MNDDEKWELTHKFIRKLIRWEWKDIVDSMSESDMSELSDYASNLSVIAAELSTYLGTRGGYGCGDHGEDETWERVIKQRKSIRKALGFSYP